VSAEDGSGVALGDRIAFSAATVDSGLLLTVGDSREPGRCCQESVPERARPPALLGGGLGLTGSARGVVSRLPRLRSTGARSELLAFACVASGESARWEADAREVLSGESLVGEMERARSARAMGG
jgi:hypothetical protein